MLGMLMHYIGKTDTFVFGGGQRLHEVTRGENQGKIVREGEKLR